MKKDTHQRPVWAWFADDDEGYLVTKALNCF